MKLKHRIFLVSYIGITGFLYLVSLTLLTAKLLMSFP
ncbi:MAG: hypothetical protein A4E57_01927 [Syntrophorhabdaceae bacterium PtaU1.Bin034]|jgi:hypothetical protein|nr:MAG: hypothetical protein A4E57_01927 [Syntrophorhabdaceae bacterium PtaU1.Bin034]